MDSYNIVYSEEYLAHWGILGQKWGKRNGPPYPLVPSKDYSKAEKAAYKAEKKANAYKKVYDSAVKVRDSSAEDKLNALDKGLKQAGKAIDTANSINNSLPAKKKNNTDLSKMSDEELRKVVNRMNLERQYNQLSNSDVKRGSDIAREIFQSVGSVVATAGTAVGIYMAIKYKH